MEHTGLIPLPELLPLESTLRYSSSNNSRSVPTLLEPEEAEQYEASDETGEQ